MSDHEPYHYFNEISIGHDSSVMIGRKYEEGYVFTRRGPHIMRQVRSVRVSIGSFQLSSENRRILKNYAFLNLHYEALPYPGYHWTIGKIAVDFYKKKTGSRAMSAQKIKTLFTSPHESMNGVFIYQWKQVERPLGYSLLFSSARMLHYAYPFYDVAHARALTLPSLGMAMMLKAILWAQEKNMDYVYLGSIHNERSLYKFQFKGVEWFNGKKWQQGKPEKSQIQISKFK
ncbi:MAG: hypothetical protein WC659_03830 [Patescibacteria group bacterium]